MRGKLSIRGIDASKPDDWTVVLETEDPSQFDREVDHYRMMGYALGHIQRDVTLTRSEKARLTQSVLKRDKHQCLKCGSAVDVKAVSIRHDEYHNADKLVTLCRICRHARKMILDKPYEESIVRAWLENGRTGMQELLDQFREERPDAFAEFKKQFGVDGAIEYIERQLIQMSFGASPLIKKRFSPKIFRALDEHTKDDRIPDAFLAVDTDSE